MNATRVRAGDLRFLLGLLLPALTVHSVTARPHAAGFIAIGVLVLIAGLEAGIPALARSPAPTADGGALRWLLRLYVPLELLLLGAGAAAAVQGSWPTVVGVGIAVGFMTGSQGITYAHELGHSRHRADRVLGWVLMTLVRLPAVHGGALPRAPRPGRYPGRSGLGPPRRKPLGLPAAHPGRQPAQRLGTGGEATAMEAPRVAGEPAVLDHARRGRLAGGAGGAGRLEAARVLAGPVRLRRVVAGDGELHRALRPAAAHAGGWPAEPFGVAHAWNADHAVSNSLLANLQRHSDHHVHAWKPFGELAALPGPQLPTGYAGCIFLAAVPPLWFRAMEPRRAGVDHCRLGEVFKGVRAFAASPRGLCWGLPCEGAAMLHLSESRVTTILPVKDLDRARPSTESRLGFSPARPKPDGAWV
jgi:alkane 1-monooxygenase